MGQLWCVSFFHLNGWINSALRLKKTWRIQVVLFPVIRFRLLSRDYCFIGFIVSMYVFVARLLWESIQKQRSHKSGWKTRVLICPLIKVSDQIDHERIASDRRSCNFFAGVLCDEHVKPGEVTIITLGSCLCYCHAQNSNTGNMKH